MLTVEDVKLYLRIDEDITEDDMFINESISAAVTYIEQMTGKPYIDEPLYRRAVQYMVAHWYENREATSSKTFVHDLPFTLAPIIRHIALSKNYPKEVTENA